MIHRNTKETYRQIRASLSPRRALVYGVINRHGRVTRHDVAFILGIDLHKLSGRFTELLATGQIIEYGSQVVDGRKRALLCINPDFQLEVAA
ncbi:MAG: hypothetical protein GY918_01230 [Gammaproteobacteria bacterium]|jgi:predicted ArsR family transcriptional regulator|nr:hypothetical protein [Gammaproteobacteria bacterium]